MTPALAKVRELVERWRWEAANRPLKYASPQGAMDGCASDLERAMGEQDCAGRFGCPCPKHYQPAPPSDEGRPAVACRGCGMFTGHHDDCPTLIVIPPAAGGEAQQGFTEVQVKALESPSVSMRYAARAPAAPVGERDDK